MMIRELKANRIQGVLTDILHVCFVGNQNLISLYQSWITCVYVVGGWVCASICISLFRSLHQASSSIALHLTFLRQGLSMNQELIIWARLSGQRARGSSWLLLSLHWYYRGIPYTCPFICSEYLSDLHAYALCPLSNLLSFWLGF